MYCGEVGKCQFLKFHHLTSLSNIAFNLSPATILPNRDLSFASFIFAIYSGLATFNRIRLEQSADFKNSFSEIVWPKPDRRNINEEMSSADNKALSKLWQMHELHTQVTKNVRCWLPCCRNHSFTENTRFERYCLLRTSILRKIFLRTKTYNPRALLDIYGFSSRVLTS